MQRWLREEAWPWTAPWQRGLAAFLTLGIYFAWRPHPVHRTFDAGAVALVIVVAGALVLRRSHPVAVLATVFGATLVYVLFGYANGVWVP